jgi:FtsP/CotA-like multicopper oxidase with cupredoxin domain
MERRMTLYAEDLPKGRLGYGLEPGKATVPGPLIEMMEGDTLAIDLVNRSSQPLSLHTHGVDYEVSSDGTPMNNGVTEVGATRTYTWHSHRPGRRADGTWDAGSAGYWPYHDHSVGSEHGTAGIAKGLYGALVVRRRGDLVPDQQFVVVMKNRGINDLIYPNTPTFTARLGERVEWIVIGLDDYPHVFHLHGHRWSDTRTGYPEGAHDNAPLVDTKEVLPATSFGFQVRAGEHGGPGVWLYRDFGATFVDQGFAGLFVVTDADGSLPPGAQAALARWH